VIHFAVLADHFEDYWLFGAFFAIVGAFQATWPVLLVRPARASLIAGATGNTAVVAVWAASRSFGVPIGPDTGTAEAVEFIDALATAFELLIVAVCLFLLLFRTLPVATPRGVQAIASIGLAVTVISLTAVAVMSDTGVGGDAHHLAGERGATDFGVPSDGSETQPGVAFRYQTDEGRFVLLEIVPFEVGNNRFKITVFDSNEEPTAIDEATIRLSRLEGDGAATELTATRSGSALYLEAESQMDDTGWWQFEAVLPRGQSATFYARLDDPSGAPLQVASPDYESDPEAEALFRQALANYQGLSSVKSREELTSGLLEPTGYGVWIVTKAEVQAPDRLHYEVISPGSSHYQVYRVGEMSCNQDAGEREWQCNTRDSSRALELDYLKPTAFKLGLSEQIGGEMTRVLLFYNPSQPAWYAWWVGEETGYLHRQAMVAPGHFMLTTFFDHNEPVAIEIPPDALTSGG